MRPTSPSWGKDARSSHINEPRTAEKAVAKVIAGSMHLLDGVEYAVATSVDEV